MTESAEQRVARLKRELAQAKVDALQAELAEAQGSAGSPATPVARAVTQPSDWLPTPYSGRPGSLFDKQVPDGSPDRGPEPPLASAPRRVPPVLRLIAFPWSWWTVFALFMVAVAPIALWLGIPLAGAVAGVVTFVVVVVLRLRKDRLQLALLRWGEVATVTDTEVLGSGTYYSGVTYQNVRMAQAHGWQVTRSWYSGPGTRTRISYELNGTKGELILHGLPYDGGVILAHSKHPKRALCVSAFAYDLDRDTSGNWLGHVAARVVIGSIAMTVILIAWTIGMVALFTSQAASLSGLVRH